MLVSTGLVTLPCPKNIYIKFLFATHEAAFEMADDNMNVDYT